jgi:hypothetical protein
MSRLVVAIREHRLKSGQVVLEYALTTLTMALVAMLAYVFYQPLVASFLTPSDLEKSGLALKGKGLGMKEVLFLPLP